MNGTQVSDAAVGISPDPSSGQTVTTGTPFASGQVIEVQVPANTIFSPNENIEIDECAAPNDVLPTQPSSCDSNTLDADTIFPNSDGSIHYSNYTIYALPDRASLGETPNGTPVCNLTSECVLYIGNSPEDFTQPHVWSQGFYVNPTTNDTGVDPGDGSAPSAAASPSATLSTVEASPGSVPADGSNSSTITVSLEGVNAQSATVPVAGAPVTLAGSTGSHSTIAPTSATTNSSGVATFTVTDATAEAVTYHATSGSVTIIQSATVAFAAPAASASSSTVVASPNDVPADGSTSSIITVTVRDQGTDPAPIAGQTVTLAASSGSNSVIVTNPATTNSAGIATFTVTDSATEAVSYTATAGGVTLTQTAYVVFGDLTVSPTASTVVASTSPAPTGPSPSGGGSEVTTTLLTSGGAHPVADKNVELMASGSAVASPPVAITNAQGQATFIVTDATAESVTVTAVDETDAGLQVGQTTVEFVAPTVSPTLSTIATVSSAPPATTTPADGTSPFNVFVTLRYTNGQEVRGDVVTLTPTVPDLQVDITPDTPVGSSTPGATDFTGVAEFQVRDTVAESVAFTATDVTAGVTLAPATPLVLTFTAGPVDLNQSSVTASPPTVPANGTSTATVAVDLTDHFGNPLAGQTVSLSQGTGHSVISPPSAVTNSAGVATFTATNTVNDDVTYTALDKSDGDLAVTQTASVRFRIPTEAGESTVTANTTTVPADGFTPAKVTVTLYDGQGNLVPGHAVSLQATPSDGAEIIPVQINGSTAAGTTDAQGQALFWVLDTKAETVGVTATDTTDATPLSEQLSITFAAGVPVVSQSSVVAAPTSVPADGVSTSTVTVTLEDTYDNPVPGKTVSLTAGGGSFTISPASAVTNPSGQAVFTVSDPTPEYVTFTARDTTDSLSIGTATVTFGVPPPVGANSTFFATPSAVPADGTTASTLSVFLRDADRRGVAGRTVILHASAGHAVLTPTFAVTNANGEATFAVTDATAQTITFTATDATDGLTLPQTVPVQFTNGGAPPSGPVSWTANGANGPFSSGQFVAIDVAANTTLASDTGLFIEECAAPSGQPPTSPSQCDAKTAQTRELFANSDGSASYVDYPVYSLPDLAGLDETSPGGPTCNLSDQCVFYVGVNPGNFSLPHLFSSAFFVNPGDGTDDGANPGNGLPEAPIIVLFPLLAAGLIGAVVLRRRRRSARSS